MLLFPPIRGQAVELQLPLDNDTAIKLIAALSTSDIADRAMRLRAILLDPSFALWSVSLAHRVSLSLETAEQAAVWLAPRLVGLLQGTGRADANQAFSLERLIAQLRALRGITAAPASCGEPGEPNPSDWRSKLALSLLVLRTQWPNEIAGGERGVFPDWLCREADALRDDRLTSRHGANGQMQRSAEHDGVEDRIVPLGEDVEVALPELLQRLMRLEELEHGFEKSLQMAKLDALKEFAYGAGHEINNPLANISARAQTLLKEEEDPERRRKLASINTQAFRAHEMIADMMLFARPPKLKRSVFPIADVIDRVITGVQPDVRDREIAIEFLSRERTFNVNADISQLQMAVRALVVNAIEAIGQGGRIEVETRLTSGEEENPLRTVSDAGLAAVEIFVRDNGPGIPDVVLPHIFDPFYSGREAGRGLGFGLSKCWQIAKQHGGKVTVEQLRAGGSQFRISLPAIVG